jgi:hypothetical protein
MQEIVAGRSWCFLSEQKSVCLGLMSYSSPRHLCLLGSFIGQIPMLPTTWRLQRPLSRGLVLDGSLGAGGTDEAFLYLRLTCKI